jgi:hypothetical protein
LAIDFFSGWVIGWMIPGQGGTESATCKVEGAVPQEEMEGVKRLLWRTLLNLRADQPSRTRSSRG